MKSAAIAPAHGVRRFHWDDIVAHGCAPRDVAAGPCSDVEALARAFRFRSKSKTFKIRPEHKFVWTLKTRLSVGRFSADPWIRPCSIALLPDDLGFSYADNDFLNEFQNVRLPDLAPCSWGRSRSLIPSWADADRRRSCQPRS